MFQESERLINAEDKLMRLQVDRDKFESQLTVSSCGNKQLQREDKFGQGTLDSLNVDPSDFDTNIDNHDTLTFLLSSRNHTGKGFSIYDLMLTALALNLEL